MTFSAGMICFGCNPRWQEFVWRDDAGRVLAINVAGESCIYLADRCGAFGRATTKMLVQVMQSSLAKRPATPLPDWSMLKDRETMCRWARGTLSMQPFFDFRPGSPYNDGSSRTISQNTAAIRLGRLGRSLGKFPGNRLLRRLGVKNTAGPAGNSSSGTSITFTATSSTTTWMASTTIPPKMASATAQPPVTQVPTAPPHATTPKSVLDPVSDGQMSGFRLGDVALGRELLSHPSQPVEQRTETLRRWEPPAVGRGRGLTIAPWQMLLTLVVVCCS